MAEAPPELSTEEAIAADPARRRFMTLIVAGHALKHTVTSGVPSVIIPELKRALELSSTQVGSLGSVQQFTGWFATMSAGYFGDRFTRKTGVMLGLSLAITGSALLLLSLSTSYAMLLFAMLCMGFGPSMFHPPAIGALSRRFPDRRSFAISMHGTGGSIGEVLGPLTAAGLIVVLAWRNVLRVEFLPAIVAAIFIFLFLKDRATAEDHDHTSFRGYLGSFGGLLKQRSLVLLLLVTACRSVGQGTTSVFLPIYLRENLGYSAGLVGVYIALGQLAGIGSQPLMGYFADRFGHKRVILPALLSFAILLALIPLADGKLMVAVVILTLGCFVFSMQSILTSAAVELAGREVHSTVVSLIYASGFVGSLAPTIAGALADHYGLASTFYFSASLALVAIAILSITKLPRRAPVEV